MLHPKALLRSYIYGGLAIIVLLVGGYGLYFLTNKRPTKTAIMRVAYPYDRRADEYDTANITLGPEYVFIDNVFSALIEMDAHGVVTSGVASRFEWIGNEAVLTIRKGLKTIDGRSITAHDAALSLKRLIILTGNVHGNVQDLLCRGQRLKSLADDCPGIVADGDRLLLKPGSRKPFLFSMLATIDFAVIPAGSFDPVTLKINDYRNTSGPYFVEEDRGGGSMTLRANPYHYHYSERIAQEVELVPMDRSDPLSSIKALAAGEVDVLTTVDAASSEDILRFYQGHSDKYTLHSSLHLRNIVLFFTDRGRQVFTREQRFTIGKLLRAAFLKYMQNTLAYKPAIQLFPVLGEGGLAKTKLEELQAMFAAAPDKIDFDARGEKIPIIRLPLRKEFAQMFAGILPGLELYDGAKNPNFLDFSANPSAKPLFFISGPDTASLEDIGLISFLMNAGYFNIPKDQQSAWLESYSHLEKKQERIAKLGAVHAETLFNAVVVPLAIAPYTAIAPKDWEIKLSPFFLNNQLWLFTRKSE